MCPQGRHSYRVFSVFWPVMEATVYNWRPHVFQLPLPIAYIKLEWLLVADTLPASEFGKYEVMSLLRAEQGGGGICPCSRWFRLTHPRTCSSPAET